MNEINDYVKQNEKWQNQTVIITIYKNGKTQRLKYCNEQWENMDVKTLIPTLGSMMLNEAKCAKTVNQKTNK